MASPTDSSSPNASPSADGADGATSVAAAATTSSAAARGRLKTALVGTVGLALLAAVGFQFWRADDARSQTTTPQAETRPPLARVNGESISYQSVADECIARHGAEVLENLVNRKLIEQACRKAQVTVSQREVEREIADQAEKFNLPIDSWYQLLANERKLSPTQYQRDVVWPMLALKKLAGQNVQVSDADMQLAFERDYGPRVKARMILIDGNQRQATKIWELATANPEKFDQLAREHSTDPNSRPLGGVIPPIRRHLGSPQFEQAAFSLAEGAISDLVQLADGQWCILKGEGRTEPVVTDINDVYTELLAQQKEEKVQVAVAQVFEEIREGAKVINHLTGTATGHAPAPGGSQVIRQASGTAAGQVRTAN